jgi:hypothetical protein
MNFPFTTELLSVMRNVAAQVLIEVTLPPGQILPGKNLRFTVKVSITDPDSTHLFQKTSPSGGITITGDFTALMDIDATDTSSLVNIQQHTLIYDLVLIDGANEYPIGFQTFTVIGNVTEPIIP